MSFLLRIPDNSRLDGSRAFSLHLTELTGGAVLGPQSAAIVTIADDDQNKTSPWLSYPAGDGLAKVGTAGQTNNLTIFAVSFSGRQQAVGGDFFLVSIENPDDQQVCHHSPAITLSYTTASRMLSGLHTVAVRHGVLLRAA